MTLRCSCGLNFTHSKRDQKFYKEKGLHPPKKCLKCRAKKHEKQPINKSSIDNALLDSIIGHKLRPDVKENRGLVSARFVEDTSLYVMDKPFNGIIRYNVLSENQISYSELKIFFNSFKERIDNHEIRLEVGNTKFKNYNGVYLYSLHPTGTFMSSKIDFLRYLKGIITTYVDIEEHFSGDSEYCNDEIWIDTKSSTIYCFGEDNIRKIYASLTESVSFGTETLSVKFKLCGTAELVEILDYIENTKYPVNLFGQEYDSDAEVLINEVIEREKSFRGLI